MFTEEELKVSRFDAADYLKTEEDIQAYLEAAAEDGDMDYLLKALNNVARARGMSEMAKEIGVNRASLYKSLDGSVKPGLHTIAKALQCFGLKFSVVRK